MGLNKELAVGVELNTADFKMGSLKGHPNAAFVTQSYGTVSCRYFFIYAPPWTVPFFPSTH